MREIGIGKFVREVRNRSARLPERADEVLMEPRVADTAAWFAKLDRARQGQFLGSRRMQPATPRSEIFA